MSQVSLEQFKCIRILIHFYGAVKEKVPTVEMRDPGETSNPAGRLLKTLPSGNASR